MALGLEWIRRQVSTGAYFFSKHADQERQNDGLLIAEVEEALRGGQIIEQYADTGRGESCLVVGFTRIGKPIHIVCGRLGETVAVVTVYIPRPPKFKTPLARR